MEPALRQVEKDFEDDFKNEAKYLQMKRHRGCFSVVGIAALFGITSLVIMEARPEIERRDILENECLQLFNENAAAVHADLNGQTQDGIDFPKYTFDETFAADGKEYNCVLHMEDDGAPTLNMVPILSNDA